LLVVTGARCPLTKPVVTAVELQATTEPHCSRGVQPGGIYVHVVQREPTPGGPGSGVRPGRRRFLWQLPLWFYINPKTFSHFSEPTVGWKIGKAQRRSRLEGRPQGPTVVDSGV
jgi:hypothetical protein